MAEQKAQLDHILELLHAQFALGDRRHEAQAALNARMSQQLRRLEEASPSPSPSPAAASAPETAESMLAKVALECGSGDISASQEDFLANASFLGGDNAFPAPETAESMQAKVALECGGDISASQEEVLANASFLGGDNALIAEADDGAEAEEEEVFSTPPDAAQQQQQQQDDPVTMCTLPSTLTPSPAPPADNATPAEKPRSCIRKARGARLRTPSPDRQQPEQKPEHQPEHRPQPEQPAHADPLVRALLMIPTNTNTNTKTTTSNSTQDGINHFLALARLKGIF